MIWKAQGSTCVRLSHKDSIPSFSFAPYHQVEIAIGEESGLWKQHVVTDLSVWSRETAVNSKELQSNVRKHET